MAIFPNIPRLPGVPPLLRAPGAGLFTIPLILADAASILRAFSAQKWGLFDTSLQPVILADAVRSLDFRASQRISTYAVEPNAFASYNKVVEPYQGRLRFMQAGSEDARRACIESVIAAWESLDLFDLVMPEFIFPDVNVTHYDFQRSADRGNGLLTVDVWCEQVRQTVGTEFIQTKSASGSATQSGGTVQTSEIPFFGAIT